MYMLNLSIANKKVLSSEDKCQSIQTKGTHKIYFDYDIKRLSKIPVLKDI